MWAALFSPDSSKGGFVDIQLVSGLLQEAFPMPGRRFGTGLLAAWEAVILEPNNGLGWAGPLIRGSCLKSRVITASEKVD